MASLRTDMAGTQWMLLLIHMLVQKTLGKSLNISKITMYQAQGRIA